MTQLAFNNAIEKIYNFADPQYKDTIIIMQFFIIKF